MTFATSATRDGASGLAVAVDVGGTFTDVALLGSPTQSMGKVPTTPDPVAGVLHGITEVLDRAHVAGSDVGQVLHATTVATNAVLQRSGARTAVVVTKGFGDIVHIGREVRTGADRFRVSQPKPHPFVVESDVFEIAERVLADGSIDAPIDEGEVAGIAERIKASGYESVAVSLLHSYLNEAHEQLVADILEERAPLVPVSLSSELNPEPGEYERVMTTIVSAYVAPLVVGYLERLRDGLRSLGIEGAILLVGSDGSFVDSAELRRRPIACLESGPVAGVLGTRATAASHQLASCLTLDVGGTTSKAGLIVHGRIEITRDFRVGAEASVATSRSADSIPIRAPVVDLAEIGVGGGSVAWVDPAGSLRIGPRSVGATPGPVSFGQGGCLPTVTDAAVVAGLLSGQNVLCTERQLDVDLATKAMAAVGDQLGIDAGAAAVAVRGAASAQVAASIQRFLYHRGQDPRGMTLVAFGGTGPLHAAEVAGIIGVDQILVPRAAGVFTAVGLASAEMRREFSRRVNFALEGDDRRSESVLSELERHALALVGERTGSDSRELRLERSAEARFRQQLQGLTVHLPAQKTSDGEILRLLHEEYERQFGLRATGAAEVTELRVRVTVPQFAVSPERGAVERWGFEVTGNPFVRLAYGSSSAREVVLTCAGSGTQEPALPGPALIRLAHTTAVVERGWTARIGHGGDLWLCSDARGALERAGRG